MCDLSVILATQNRERLLDQTLAGLAGQIADGLRWEVIVVDNGSTDKTAEVLSRWQTRLPVTALHEPVAGKNRALNRALPVARGEYFVFTDDDIIPAPNWLRELYDGAQRWPDDIVFGGKILPCFPDETPAFLRADHFRYAALAYSRYVPQISEGPVLLEPFGPNMMVHRRAFDSLRYTEQLGPTLGSYSAGSEMELLIRLHNLGHRFIYLPAAVVEHTIEPHQLQLRWLLERANRFGRAAVWIEPQRMGPTLFSIPRYLWRGVMQAVISAAVDSVRGKERRWSALMSLWHVMGMVREYRWMGRERENNPRSLQGANS
jgi:glycosyltransferase involved in cell wall biosynthesis